MSSQPNRVMFYFAADGGEQKNNYPRAGEEIHPRDLLIGKLVFFFTNDNDIDNILVRSGVSFAKLFGRYAVRYNINQFNLTKHGQS